MRGLETNTAKVVANRREFLIGFAASLSYFVALFLLPAVLFLNAFVLIVLAYFTGLGLVAALLLGVPLAIIGQWISHRYPGKVIGILVHFGVGVVTAYLGFGIFTLLAQSRFAPLYAFGPDSPFAVAILMGIAGVCTLGGWATARRNLTPTDYDDALEGLDFAELADLIRKARDDESK